MPAERWAGFALVWLALTCLTWDALRTARSNKAAALRLAAEAAAAGAGPVTTGPAGAVAARAADGPAS
jgi:chloramphenicol-sensitive protein RarD